MALVDLKRSNKEKSEEADETAPVAASQPDYGYGLCIHLEDNELEKLGITDLPKVGDEYHIRAIAKVKGVNERDYGKRKEAGVDLQITMMEATHEDEEPGEEDSVAEEESEDAEDQQVTGGARRTILHSTYRGRG